MTARRTRSAKSALTIKSSPTKPVSPSPTRRPTLLTPATPHPTRSNPHRCPWGLAARRSPCDPVLSYENPLRPDGAHPGRGLLLRRLQVEAVDRPPQTGARPSANSRLL